MKVLIVAPMQIELDGLLQGFTQRGVHSVNGQLGRLPIKQLPELNITLAVGGFGKTQFGVQTQHLLDVGNGFEAVLCAGAAGGLAPHVSVGDVVAATTTIEHDYNNKFTRRPKPSFNGAPTLLAALQFAHVTDTAFKVHYGVIASGDEDIVDEARGKELREATGALAVAWEGVGGARACAFSHVPYVEIRGVTDNADHSAPSDFRTNLTLAMNNVVALLMAWLQSAGSANPLR